MVASSPPANWGKERNSRCYCRVNGLKIDNDDPDFVLGTRMVLESGGYEVGEAPGGQVGVEVRLFGIKRASGTFRILFRQPLEEYDAIAP